MTYKMQPKKPPPSGFSLLQGTWLCKNPSEGNQRLASTDLDTHALRTQYFSLRPSCELQH